MGKTMTTCNWHNYGDVSSFWDNGGIIIRQAFNNSETRRLPELQNLYEVFELARNKSGQHIAYSGIVQANRNESERDIVNRISRNWINDCMYYTTYCQNSDDFRITERQLNKWLFQLDYCIGMKSEKEYASYLFGDCSFDNIDIFYDKTTAKMTARFNMNVTDKLRNELIERANEDYGIYNQYGKNNIYDFLDYMKGVTTSVDIYKDTNDKLKMFINVAFYDKNGYCVFNRPVNSTDEEVAVLYKKANQFLELCNKTYNTHYSMRNLVSNNNEDYHKTPTKPTKRHDNFER